MQGPPTMFGPLEQSRGLFHCVHEYKFASNAFFRLSKILLYTSGCWVPGGWGPVYSTRAPRLFPVASISEIVASHPLRRRNAVSVPLICRLLKSTLPVGSSTEKPTGLGEPKPVILTSETKTLETPITRIAVPHARQGRNDPVGAGLIDRAARIDVDGDLRLYNEPDGPSVVETVRVRPRSIEEELSDVEPRRQGHGGRDGDLRGDLRDKRGVARYRPGDIGNPRPPGGHGLAREVVDHSSNDRV